MGLRDELTQDPLARGYASMTGQQAADSLNAVNRAIPRTSISGSDLLACTSVAELTALTAASRDVYLALIQMDSLDITSANVRSILGTLFGVGTMTRANLVALGNSTVAVNRATELGLGVVTAGEVERARAGA